MNAIQRLRQEYLQNARTGAPTNPHSAQNPHQRGMAGTPADAGCPTRNVNDRSFSCEGAMSEQDLPPVLGCNVIGGNTFNLAVPGGAGAGLGAPAGSPGFDIAIDAGDACRYRPRSLLICAFQADGATANLIALPLVQVPTLLTNARTGSIPMIRRTGQLQFGICSQGYSDQKELTCVDWSPFTSVQNQGLTLTFANMVGVTVHVFVDLWGDNLS